MRGARVLLKAQEQVSNWIALIAAPKTGGAPSVVRSSSLRKGENEAIAMLLNVMVQWKLASPSFSTITVPFKKLARVQQYNVTLL